jgi:putative acetyltransferase
VKIAQGRLDDPQVRALIALHRGEAHATTPSDNAHAMDADGLRDPAITFLSAWEGERLLGIGAIRELAPDHAELKSMRTDPAHLRKGVSRALFDHMVGIARERGYARLSLETGTAAMFGPANAMYERYGFVDGPAFGGYPASPHNRFMYMDL